MISAATIAALEQQNIDYILGARERSTTEIRKTVLEGDGVAVPLLIPRQKGARHQGHYRRWSALCAMPQRGGSQEGR
jgi:hypothetical protein